MSIDRRPDSGTARPGGALVARALAAARPDGLVVPTDARAGARYQRLQLDGRRYFLKQLSPASDWIMRVIGDQRHWAYQTWTAGIMERAAVCVDHTVVDMHITGSGAQAELTILMADVTEQLLPAGAEPVSPWTHGRFISAMADLTVSLWEWPDDLGLMGMDQRLTMLAPHRIAAELAAPVVPGPVEAAHRGWQVLDRRAPELARLTRSIHRDPGLLTDRMRQTPNAFLQGDWKMGNLGIRPDGTVILLDWAFPGRAPACWDLWWYLALNRERLPETKAGTLLRYRTELEQHGVGCADWWDEHNALCAIGVMATFGWEKALGDDDELAWWERTVLAAAGRLGLG